MQFCILFLLLNNLVKVIGDIWDDNNKDFRLCNVIYDQLTDQHNHILEYSRVTNIQTLKSQNQNF